MFRVLVLPSCNEPGLEIIHALAKSNKVMLFGASSVDPTYDASRAILAHHATIPWHESEDFAPTVRGILDDWAIDLVFPTVDTLVTEFSGWSHRQAHFVTPPAATAQLILSKSKTYRALAGCVPVPRVYSQTDVTFPAYAKPDSGGGAKGHSKRRVRETHHFAPSREKAPSAQRPANGALHAPDRACRVERAGHNGDNNTPVTPCQINAKDQL